jgi:hypothetical protein
MSANGNWISELANRKGRSVWSKVGGWMKDKLNRDRSPFDSLPKFAGDIGQPVWGALLKVNRVLLAPDSSCKGSFGLMVVAPDIDQGTAFEVLPTLVRALHDLLDSAPTITDPEAIDVIQRVDDDRVGEFRITPLPSSLTPGYSAVILNAVIDRKALPEGFVRSRVLPMFFIRGYGYVSPVPHGLWNREFLADWNQSTYSLSKGHPSDGSEFCALEVTGLPPECLDSLEQIVHQYCEQRGVKCHFLNAGAFHQPGQVPPPGSGDLCFLGDGSDIDKIADLLADALTMLLTDEQGQLVDVVELELDDFVERYGPVMDLIDEHNK